MSPPGAASPPAWQSRPDSVGLGYALRALGVLSAVIGFVISQASWIIVRVETPARTVAQLGGEKSFDGGLFIVAIVCGTPFLLAAVILVRRSRRHLAPSGEEVMRRDSRPPVVYLRSFSADKRTARQRFGGFGPWIFLWPAAFYVIRQEWRGSSEEEDWSAALSKVGPPIALGAPGQLPFRGVGRIYVTGDAWRDVVLDFVQRAALVVVLGGETEALWWEIRQVVASEAREKLIFLLPNRRRRYEAFRDALRRELAVDPGDHPNVFHRLDVCGVLRFRADGESEVLPVWGASRTNIIAAVQPLIERHHGQPASSVPCQPPASAPRVGGNAS